MENCQYITINHLEEFSALEYIRIGMHLKLKKDHSNPYDDEAIAVYSDSGRKYGYVANSVCSVCRGTGSAGYIYHQFEEETGCTVRFLAYQDGFAIAEMDMQTGSIKGE